MKHAQAIFLAALVVLGLPGAVEAQDKYISEGDTWRYFKGTEEPPSDWNTLGFNDADWLEGATPIGYSSDIAYKTVLSDMGGTAGYLSVYIRKTFTIPSAAAVKSLKLSMKYDDSFVAYLNGVEVSRLPATFGTVGTRPTFDTAGVDHETNTTFQDIPLSCAAVGADLKDGDNVLAIQGHNVSLTSSDFTLSVELTGLTEFCPTTFTATLRADNTSIQLRWTRPAGITYESLELTRNGEDIVLSSPSLVSYIDKTPAPGENRYVLTATLCDTTCPIETSIVFSGGGEKFRRGDADGNAAVNLTDPVFILNALFQGGTAPGCPDAADADDNGAVNITDAVYLLNFLFQGGPTPPAPGPTDCGVDATQDGLDICVSTPCS